MYDIAKLYPHASDGLVYRAFDHAVIAAMGMVAAIPWFPEPELVMAGSVAPPMRASDAELVR